MPPAAIPEKKIFSYIENIIHCVVLRLSRNHLFFLLIFPEATGVTAPRNPVIVSVSLKNSQKAAKKDCRHKLLPKQVQQPLLCKGLLSLQQYHLSLAFKIPLKSECHNIHQKKIHTLYVSSTLQNLLMPSSLLFVVITKKIVLLRLKHICIQSGSLALFNTKRGFLLPF